MEGKQLAQRAQRSANGREMFVLRSRGNQHKEDVSHFRRRSFVRNIGKSSCPGPWTLAMFPGFEKSFPASGDLQRKTHFSVSLMD